MLFIRGKAISGTDNIRGIIQFPKPPIMIGITIKKIIKNACIVTKVMYSYVIITLLVPSLIVADCWSNSMVRIIVL